MFYKKINYLKIPFEFHDLSRKPDPSMIQPYYLTKSSAELKKNKICTQFLFVAII